MSLNTKLATAPNTTDTYVLKASGTSIGNSIMYQDSGGGMNVAYSGTTGGARIRITPDTPQGYIEAYDGSGSFYKLVLATGGLSVRNGLSTSLLEIATSGAATFSSSVKSDGGASEGKFIIERDSVATNTIIGSLDFTNNNAVTTYGKVFGGRNSAGDGYVALGTGVSNNLYALESGNVGIGTSSPDTLLTVNGASGTKSFALVNSGGGTRADFTITENDGLYINSNEGATNRAIYFQTGGTTRATITSAGNIGFGANGTTNVGGFGSLVATIQSPNSTYGTLEIGKATASTSSNLGVLSFFNGTNGDICNIIGVSTDANNSGALRFGTANAGVYGERMRITSEVGTANVCIGTTSSPQANTGRGALTINGSSTTILTMAIGGAEKGYVYHNASEINLVNSTPGRLYCIAYTGGVYLNSGATSWTANSDERLKDITGNIENAVDSLMTLRAVKHTWKADEDKVEKLALIAQDVEKVFPQVVDKGKLPSKPNEEQTDETEYLGVRYQELIPVLVKAIQELNQKVNDQQQTINSLINR
jgi:hypothetical protein